MHVPRRNDDNAWAMLQTMLQCHGGLLQLLMLIPSATFGTMFPREYYNSQSYRHNTLLNAFNRTAVRTVSNNIMIVECTCVATE